MNMTAERSLEIITEQIVQSRKAVSKDVGQSLYVLGLYTMGMAVVVSLINYFSLTPLGHLLWLVLPFIIWWVLRNNKERVNAPVNLVGTLVSKTWWTFAVFAISYKVLATIWNFIMARMCSPDEYVRMHMTITPIVILLMAMAVSITGHILKNCWLVWFGITAGLLVAINSHVGVGTIILARLYPPHVVGGWSLIDPCPILFLFSFIGLMLPGLMLKKQK